MFIDELELTRKSATAGKANCNNTWNTPYRFNDCANEGRGKLACSMPSAANRRVTLNHCANEGRGKLACSMPSAANRRVELNAKEFDEETGMYYYGARYYEPRLSLWMSVDPKEEDYPMPSTYCFVNNNPIIFIDLRGLDSYYTMDGEYLGDNSKKTQYVYVVSAGGYRQYKKGHYAITRNKAIQLRDNKNNPITKDDFNDLAGTLYAEMSNNKNNTWLEAAAIYSVLENRGNEDGKSTLQVASGGGIYGYSKRSKISSDLAPKNLVKNAYKGLIRGILDKKDYSNGGYFWHGKDFSIKTLKAYNSYYKVGFHFTDKSHDIWKREIILLQTLNGHISMNLQPPMVAQPLCVYPINR